MAIQAQVEAHLCKCDIEGDELFAYTKILNRLQEGIPNYGLILIDYVFSKILPEQIMELAKIASSWRGTNTKPIICIICVND